ncbi:MAG: long-chain-fatty-acid--CoA ligase [Proteobacteria bacterium]|nr:long-chain-fatty-acid--CoA ligase [Pseudomonadota bacterium]MBI3496167.1 long-chain-fatty-acid--CoA ligase [Pseudomonadota bacterium]
MRGMMMDRPLLIQSLLEHAATRHADTEIVSRTVEGPIHRHGYADAERRAKRLANALTRLGIGHGDRVATLAWNGYRHFELYFAVSGMGAVCHTINPRLSPTQLEYIVNHAEDRLLFLDASFLPLVEKLAQAFPSIRYFVVMTDQEHMPKTSIKQVLCYEELLAVETDHFVWPSFDENTAASLCYTSGTTGNPKGTLYSHRSTVLHSYAVCMADTVGLSSVDSVCPIVPMFHVNAWGMPYAAPMTGAKLVFPGPNLDGASLHKLFEAERVTLTLGVPTVWLALLKHMDDSASRFSTLNRTVIGGSAVPRAMIEAFENRYGVAVVQGWGMTEMSPVGTVGTLKAKHRALPADRQVDYKVKQGRFLYGVEARILDADDHVLPNNGVSVGEMVVRGPWIASGYFNDEKASREAVTADGWFRTGDVCTIDADGYVQITDRRKDVIKSGGEWISSIDLENLAVGHPDVMEAGAIGIPHPKWGERPLLVVVPKSGRAPTAESILAYMADRMPKWMLPDAVVSVAELPHTATGKILKTKLREQFREYRLPTA